MNFEERIDRLTQRHEALAKSAETHNAMLARMEALQGEQSLAMPRQREMLDRLLASSQALLDRASGT